MLRKLLCLSIVVAAISGCATMSKEECLTADWYMIGQGDAEQGSSRTMLDVRRKDCAKAGVTPSLRDYDAGYEKGLKRYCTASNGYTQGVSGANYQGICTGFRADDFLSGYNSGLELFAARDRVNRVRNDISSYQQNIYNIRSEVSNLESRLVAGDTTQQQRYDYLERIKSLQRDLGENENNLRGAERETGRLERDLDYMEHKHQNLRF